MEAAGTLVGGIARDFDHMLSGIVGNLFQIKEKTRDLPDVSTPIEEMEAISKRAAEVIDQLLIFARKGCVEMEVFSLTDFIRETLKLRRWMLPEYITFDRNICSDPLHILGDSTQLQHVVINLLNNAREATSVVAQPSIKVRLESYVADDDFMRRHPGLRTAHFACLSVIDNGHGIVEEHLEHVFEPFFTTKVDGAGRGLGLAMTHGAVHTHGGVIDAESVAGKGATFRVYLPLLD
jgi:signal transduction histidine kinase